MNQLVGHISKLCEQACAASAKKIIMFDLDGTLTRSKISLDREMAVLLRGLLERKIVAVVGGGSFAQFKKQFLFFFYL